MMIISVVVVHAATVAATVDKHILFQSHSDMIILCDITFFWNALCVLQIFIRCMYNRVCCVDARADPDHIRYFITEWCVYNQSYHCDKIMLTIIAMTIPCQPCVRVYKNAQREEEMRQRHIKRAQERSEQHQQQNKNARPVWVWRYSRV